MWSDRQGQGIEAHESSRDMVAVRERKREVLGMPCNIGTIGEGNPIAAHNLAIRYINIRDPQRDLGGNDFNQNVLLDQTSRYDFYQGRHPFLISPTRNSNGRRDYGNYRNGADYAQRSLGTCTRNIEHGTHLLVAHYRIQERVRAAVNQYLQGNRVIHLNYRRDSDHWGPYLDLESPISNEEWEANRIAGCGGDHRHSMLSTANIRKPWNRYRPVNYVADLPGIMSGRNQQPPHWYHTNAEPRTGDNGEYARLRGAWAEQASWIRVETERLLDNSDYVVQCLMDSIHRPQDQNPVDMSALVTHLKLI